MAHVTQMLTQEPIYKPSSIFCFKPNLLSAHKLILLIYGDNRYIRIFRSSTKLSSIFNDFEQAVYSIKRKAYKHQAK